jgi:hypothetical protein
MKTYLSILFLFFSLNSFGQQFLWTTNKNGLFPNSDMKVISNDEVLDKLKIYHDSYDYYYDGTGFTKEGFFRMFESSNTYKSTEKTNWELFQKTGVDWLVVDSTRPSVASYQDFAELVKSEGSISLWKIKNPYQGEVLKQKNPCGAESLSSQK